MLKLIVCIAMLVSAYCEEETLTCKKTKTDQSSGNHNVGNIYSIQAKLKSLAQEVEALKNQTSLYHDVEVLKNKTKENSQLVAEVINEKYFSLGGYIYRLTPSLLPWQRSREFCQDWGGDLAVHGVKTITNRMKLIDGLAIANWFWIGASDIALENNWIWLNGESAKSYELNWHAGEPNNYAGNEDCAFVEGRREVNFSQNPGRALAWDAPCTWSHQGLCEKAL